MASHTLCKYIIKFIQWTTQKRHDGTGLWVNNYAKDVPYTEVSIPAGWYGRWNIVIFVHKYKQNKASSMHCHGLCVTIGDFCWQRVLSLMKTVLEMLWKKRFDTKMDQATQIQESVFCRVWVYVTIVYIHHSFCTRSLWETP